jgi:predicted site-specific integrase-resolvase
MAKDVTPPIDPLVPVAQICAEFGISRTTYWRWERDGILPRAHKIRNRNYQPRSVLDELRAEAARPGGVNAENPAA